MRKLDYYWCSNKDWYHYENDGWKQVLNSDAPKEAKKSYRHYKRQVKWMGWENSASEPIGLLLMDIRTKYLDLKYKISKLFNKD